MEEAYEMMKDAYEYSKKYETPVILKPTTRICHGYGYASMEMGHEIRKHTTDGFKKDSRWVIIHKLSYEAHLKISSRNPILNIG